MKWLIHILCLLSLGMILAAGAYAQQQKVGYVDTDQIISHIPEYNGISRELDAISREWRDKLKEMQFEINQLKEDLSAKEILYTEEIRNQREQEIQNKIRAREEYLNQKFGPEGEYFKRQQELLEPIQRKIFEAIAVIAANEGYDLIFDRAQDSSLLFAQPEWNLNREVLSQMGINPEDTSN